MEKMLLKTPINSKQRLFYIEVLRIIACFAVILLHSTGTLVTNTSLYGTHTWNFINFINAIISFRKD